MEKTDDGKVLTFSELLTALTVLTELYATAINAGHGIFANLIQGKIEKLLESI